MRYVVALSRTLASFGLATFILYGSLSNVLAQQTLQVDAIGAELNMLSGELIGKVSDRTNRLSFNALREKVLQASKASPIYQASLDRLSISGARVEESKARFLPQISLSADRGRDEPLGSTASKDFSSQTLSVNQFLYDFGSASHEHDAITLENQAAELTVLKERGELLLRLITTYYEVFRASKQLEISESFIASREQFLDLIRKREAIGGSSRADSVRAEAKLAEALDSLPTASQRLLSAKHQYMELFREQPSFIDLHELPEMNLEDRERTVMTFARQSVASIQGRLEIDIAKRKLEAEKGKRYGQFELQATYSRGGSGRPSGFDQTAGRIQYSLNVFSGFSQQSRISQSVLSLDEAKQKLKSIEYEQERLIRDALLAYETMNTLVDSRVGLVRRAKSASDITRELFVLNRGSIADIFRAQEDYISATRNLLDAVVDRAVSFYRLLQVANVLPETMDKID